MKGNVVLAVDTSSSWASHAVAVFCSQEKVAQCLFFIGSGTLTFLFSIHNAAVMSH